MPSTISASKSNPYPQWLKAFGVLTLAGGVFIGIVTTLWFTQTPQGMPVARSLQSLFAMNTVQAWWYITRAAGLTSYFLLWLSMVWGMVLPTKFFQGIVEGTFAYDFHEFLSLLGLGFVLLHVIVLMLDQYLPFSIWEIVIPFIDAYRPLWVGFGIIGFYLFLLVTVTFYMRKTIGMKAFRAFHVLSIIGYIGATLHGLFAGTDSALPVTKFLYAGTFLIVSFLTMYWLVFVALAKREQARAEAARIATHRRAQRLRQSQR